MKTTKTLFQSLFEAITVYETNERRAIVYWLLEHFLSISKTDVLIDKALIETLDWKPILQRINAHEPIQYVLGETEFFQRKYKVTPAVLIPRPETEELVQHVLELLENKANPAILDIGTGSGCIAISLACEKADASVMAFDISEEALKVSAENAKKNNANIDFRKVDVLSENLLEKDVLFDAIISNPPYVMQKESESMRENVLKFEPHIALFVEDTNPLIFYEAIANFGKKHLKKNGFLFFEINENLGKETAELLISLQYKAVEIQKDIFQKQRFVKAFF